MKLVVFSVVIEIIVWYSFYRLCRRLCRWAGSRRSQLMRKVALYCFVAAVVLAGLTLFGMPAIEAAWDSMLVIVSGVLLHIAGILWIVSICCGLSPAEQAQ